MFKAATVFKTARPQYLAVFSVTLMVAGFKGRQAGKAATAKCWRSLPDIGSTL